MSLNEAELDVIEKITDAANAFLSLPPCHPSEMKEATLHIHALQTLLMARSAVRSHPDMFRVHEFR